MTKFIHTTANVSSKNIGKGTYIWQYVVILEGAVIGKNCNINAHVFIENNVKIGDRVTVKSGVQLWNGITLEDDVFIGPNATFTNDHVPKSKQPPQEFEKTLIKKGASIGANATILCNLTIGKNAMIGAGSVVTKNVGDYELWYGNPAKHKGYITKNGKVLDLNMIDTISGEAYTWKKSQLVTNDSYSNSLMVKTTTGKKRTKTVHKLLPTEKYGCYFRLVELEDAAFILTLRNNEKLSENIHYTSSALSDQIGWMKDYKEREKLGQDFYLIALSPDQKERYGVSRIYNLTEDQFELGSWVFSPDAPKDKSVLTDVFIRTLAFEELGFKKCFMSVRKKNLPVQRYIKAFNPEPVGESEEDLYFLLDYPNFIKRRESLLKLFGQKV
ncbi:DapH/DapD/GlmU-related protein [Lentiprolixibacter aurantiacus]|uniref:DapH/DapD/GlmU-related protein n=1 Tax=Lentiprolixibacter aurantiacus TaxID=2993939 RepID=A0AAE3SP55_9FLAO|nr:DapH/DapD/GlmU-related protein [Lentiprolixibacter aurantiacus]MCX2719851.1 DapH/DapD/GlmU-related protein [Lentiprolixibacter aurantiacus]